MATIKDIAQALGISPSTVSIVLRGNGEKRNISKSTIEKVFACAKELDYQPNIVAKRLREINSPYSYTIAVFWTSDFRASMLVRFLRGLQKAIDASGLNIEFFIRQYENDFLSMTLTESSFNMFHGAIVCNASEKDIMYIESVTFLKPIVLYNRRSPIYSTVSIDDKLIGRIAADEFYKHHCRRSCIITSESVFAGMLERTDSFISRIKEYSIEFIDIFQVNNSISGGYSGGRKLLNLPYLPDSIFCASDMISMGVLYALNEAGVSIPDKVKLISVGNGDREMEEFTYPPLSVVYIPIEEMAINCLRLLVELFPLNIAADQREIIIDTPYIPRRTCPKTD